MTHCLTSLTRWLRPAGLAAGLLALAGCANMDGLPKSEADYTPVYPVASETPRLATGGIYRAGSGEALLGRGRRFQVGDVVTVLLNESTQAARQASANVSRGASNDIIPSGISTKLASRSSLLTGLNLNESNVESAGEGNADQRARLNGEVTVTVVEVLSNGNLVVRGEKQMSLTQGSEVIQVSGIIRAEDIAPNNTVQSRRLANARFTYQGSGEIASATRAGWGTRALLKFWPF